MFRFIKKMFYGLLTITVNAFGRTKDLSLSNQQCMTQTTLINLHPNEYTHELSYYPFIIN